MGGLIKWLEGGRRTHSLGMIFVFMRELLFDILDTRFIDRQMKQFQPDVIYLGHITILTRALMPYLATCHVPIVYDEGGSGLIDSREEKGIWYKFIEEYEGRFPITSEVKSIIITLMCWLSAQRIKSKWAWPTDLHIFFNSELNRRNAIIKGVPVSGARVIHSGIDAEKFSFLPRSGFGLPIVIISPGRFEPRKGQLDAVKIIAKLVEAGLNVILILIGTKGNKSYYQDVEKSIRILHMEEKIILMHMVEHNHIVDIYHKADICLFPSYYKTGFSRIPMEAMACGSIVISYGNEGSDEIIRDRQTGFIVDPGDLSGIVKIIKEMILDPEMSTKIAQEARREIEDEFSMQKYVDQIETILTAAFQEK
jgi:glycosyltransferase involved in cell wall biosynthesis